MQGSEFGKHHGALMGFLIGVPTGYTAEDLNRDSNLWGEVTSPKAGKSGQWCPSLSSAYIGTGNEEKDSAYFQIWIRAGVVLLG